MRTGAEAFPLYMVPRIHADHSPNPYPHVDNADHALSARAPARALRGDGCRIMNRILSWLGYCRTDDLCPPVPAQLTSPVSAMPTSGTVRRYGTPVGCRDHHAAILCGRASDQRRIRYDACAPQALDALPESPKVAPRPIIFADAQYHCRLVQSRRRQTRAIVLSMISYTSASPSWATRIVDIAAVVRRATRLIHMTSCRSRSGYAVAGALTSACSAADGRAIRTSTTTQSTLERRVLSVASSAPTAASIGGLSGVRQA